MALDSLSFPRTRKPWAGVAAQVACISPVSGPPIPVTITNGAAGPDCRSPTPVYIPSRALGRPHHDPSRVRIQQPAAYAWSSPEGDGRPSSLWLMPFGCSGDDRRHHVYTTAGRPARATSVVFNGRTTSLSDGRPSRRLPASGLAGEWGRRPACLQGRLRRL